MEIKRVAVIGAGVMGSGIAAQVANAGVPVLLLDIVPPEGPRNALAQGAVDRLLKADPAPFMTKKAAALVTPGNLEGGLAPSQEQARQRCKAALRGRRIFWNRRIITPALRSCGQCGQRTPEPHRYGGS